MVFVVLCMFMHLTSWKFAYAIDLCDGLCRNMQAMLYHPHILCVWGRGSNYKPNSKMTWRVKRISLSKRMNTWKEIVYSLTCPAHLNKLLYNAAKVKLHPLYISIGYYLVQSKNWILCCETTGNYFNWNFLMSRSLSDEVDESTLARAAVASTINYGEKFNWKVFIVFLHSKLYLAFFSSS